MGRLGVGVRRSKLAHRAFRMPDDTASLYAVIGDDSQTSGGLRYRDWIHSKPLIQSNPRSPHRGRRPAFAQEYPGRKGVDSIFAAEVLLTHQSSSRSRVANSASRKYSEIFKVSPLDVSDDLPRRPEQHETRQNHAASLRIGDAKIAFT